jgi:hypothetical protein
MKTDNDKQRFLDEYTDDELKILSAISECELAEFIAFLICRVEAHGNGCFDCQCALDRDMWPDHPIMTIVTEMLDNG